VYDAEIADKALQRVNADGAVFVFSIAFRFAGMRTDAAADRGKWILVGDLLPGRLAR
jgi:hypothetical protein